MRQTVAVGGELSPFRQELEAAGFHVITLTDATIDDADAVVIDGMENDFLGIEPTRTKAPVIDADGMTPAEVVFAVKSRALVR